MKQCRHCQNYVPDDAPVCPHCQDVKLPKPYRYIVPGVLAAGLTAGGILLIPQKPGEDWTVFILLLSGILCAILFIVQTAFLIRDIRERHILRRYSQHKDHDDAEFCYCRMCGKLKGHAWAGCVCTVCGDQKYTDETGHDREGDTCRQCGIQWEETPPCEYHTCATCPQRAGPGDWGMCMPETDPTIDMEYGCGRVKKE